MDNEAALFITKNHLSCSNFVEVCALLELYGIKLTEKELYLTKYSYYEMLETFCEVISKHLIEKVKRSKYYSIIMNESTDIGGRKELIIYIKYFDWTENVIHTYKVI